MKVLSYTVVVRYQAIILDFRLTQKISLSMFMLRGFVIFPRWKYAKFDDFDQFSEHNISIPLTRNDWDSA